MAENREKIETLIELEKISRAKVEVSKFQVLIAQARVEALEGEDDINILEWLEVQIANRDEELAVERDEIWSKLDG